MTWILLALAIVSEVAATLSLRASNGLKKKIWIAPVSAGYGAAISLLALVLALGMPVGIAYGVWAACGVALTAIGARVFFKESLTARMTIGILLIGIGVIIIEMGAQH